MDDNIQSDVPRRRILKSAAVSSALGVGLVGKSSASSSATAKSSIQRVIRDLGFDADENVLPQLREHNVIIEKSDTKNMIANIDDFDATFPEDVRTGRALLAVLTNAGHLDSTSVDQLLEDSLLDQVGKEAYDVVSIKDADGGLEISFRLETSDGRLQITFEEYGTPFAAFTPDDGGRTILYVTSDDRSGYKRVEMNQRPVRNEDSAGIGPESCDPPCNETWCGSNCTFWFGDKFHQRTKCVQGECHVSTNCNC